MQIFNFEDTYSLNELYGSIRETRERLEKMMDIFGASDIRIALKVFDSVKGMGEYLHISMKPWIKAVSFRNCIVFLQKCLWNEKEEKGYNDILIHEIAHCLVYKRYPHRLPVWLNEGIAMYFGEQLYNIKASDYDLKPSEIGSLGYETKEFYNYSILVMNALLSIYSINEILCLADDYKNFDQDGSLGNALIRKICFDN